MSNIVDVILKATDQASTTMGKVNSAFKELTGVSIGAASAVAAIGKGLQYVINEAIEAEKADAKLNQALQSTKMIAGVTKDDLDRMASSLSRVTTFSEETVKGAESLLLTFTKIGRETFPDALEAALNLSTAFGQDLQSSTIQIGKALNDPNGMAAMRRIGVSFTEAQIEMGKAMFETGDIAGYQKLILEELNTEIGGMARAMGTTYAGQVEILKNNMGELGETIGKVLVPTLSVAAKALNDLVTMNKQIADSVYETGVRVAREGKPYEYYRDSILDVLQANGKLTVAQRRIIEGFQDGSISAKAFQEDYDLLIQRTGLMTEEMFLEAAAADELSESMDGVAESTNLSLDAAMEYYSNVQVMYSNVTSLGKGLQENEKKLLDAETELNEYIKNNPWDTKGIDDRIIAVEKLKQEQQSMVNEWMLAIFTDMALADKEMSDREMEFLFQYQVDTGMLSEENKKRAMDYWDQAGEIFRANTEIQNSVDALHGTNIHNTVTTDIVTNHVDNYYVSGSQGTAINRHAAGGLFEIPAAYGNEGFRLGNGDTASAGEGVQIIPKNEMNGGASNSALLAAIHAMPRMIAREMRQLQKYG